MRRDAPASTRRQRFAPICFSRHQIQDRTHARLVYEQSAPQLIGIFPAGVGQLIEEGFNRKAIV